MAGKARLERFDEVYKLLLGLLAILISFSMGFLRNIAMPLLALYIIALVMWVLGNLLQKLEYAFKSLGWYWLVLSLFSASYRALSLTEVIRQPIITIIAVLSIASFLLMLVYLWAYIGGKAKMAEIVAVIVFSLIIIIGAQ